VRLVLGHPGAAVQVLGGLLLADPGAQFPATVLASVPGQRDEEPVDPGHVPEPLGALQGELPVRANLRCPFLLVAVLHAEQRRPDGAEHVVPRR
jgi:hypothetical protein